MFWLGWKEETTIRKQDALGLKTTLSLCSTRKSSSQVKSTNAKIQFTNVMAKRKVTLRVRIEKRYIPNRFEEALGNIQQNVQDLH